MPSATTIPRGRPEPISLDFDRLRAEGIQHLENIATEVWTDFNAGQPGITILEVLCYAITDLGFRTVKTPIADLATPADKRKVFFLPEEILTSTPVTPNDFRKLLIDLPGVKNAWLEEVYEPFDSDKFQQLALYYMVKEGKPVKSFPQHLLDRASLAVTVSEKEQFIRSLLKDYSGKIPSDHWGELVDYIVSEKRPQNPDLALIAILNYLDCVFKITPIRFSYPFTDPEWKAFDPMAPIGLYRIILDLDDDIGAVEEKEQFAAKYGVINALHANRGLCHDYQKIDILDTEEIAVCLDIQLENGVDTKMVLAEVLYQLQDFLTPAVRFYSLAEMLKKRKADGENYRMDDIYNGPLLQNGFIDDIELERHQTKPDPEIKFSDLFAVIAPKEPGNSFHIPGLIAVNSIGLRWLGETQWHTWDDSSDGKWRTSNPAFEKINNFKYKIKPVPSQFQVSVGGGVPFSIKFSAFREEYEQLVLERTCKNCSSQNTLSPAVSGKNRKDLAVYQSIQYDFPSVYRLGKHQWMPDAPGQKTGPMHQMQAYLMFFDQILAAYLKRLGQVAELLAVEQSENDIKAPSFILPTLFDVPGMKEMLEAKGLLFIKKEDLGKMAPGMLALVGKNNKDQEKQYEDVLAALTAMEMEDKAITIPQVRNNINAVGGGMFLPVIEKYLWEKFTADESSNFQIALKEISESNIQRQNRRNILLDHLLGRFGETFSEFVASLLTADLAPEDNPGWRKYDEYLSSKALFLNELPLLGYNRPKGYNYRKLIGGTNPNAAPGSDLPRVFEGITTQMNNQPDVWNSPNIAGVKKRICYLLGMNAFKEGLDEDGKRHFVWESTTLLGEPLFTLDLVSETERGKQHFYLALRRKTPPGSERLDRSDSLMQSNRYTSRKQALELRKELYNILDEKNCFKLEQDKEDGSLVYLSFQKNSKELLFSDGKKLERAEILMREVLNLVEPRESRDHDGFHLLEHILLRPKEINDDLLQISLNGIEPPDPYSNIATIVAPNWTRRFKHESFREIFEKTVAQELPAYVFPRICYVDRDTMQKFEIAFKEWMIALATCNPNKCEINDKVKILTRLLEEEIHSAGCCSTPISGIQPCAQTVK